MIAHVGGVPVEELLGPLVLGATAFVVGTRVLIARRLGLRRPVPGAASEVRVPSARERSTS